MSASAVLGPQRALAMTPLGAAMRMLSPYQFNPFNLNPLRDALVEEVDFARLRAEAPVKLLIAATRVSDGRQRIFRENELTADMVLASTCLPLLHHAVKIDGEDYWDGGYVANPPLFPLALASEAEHILAVLVTPNAVERTPLNRRDIIKRLEQIQFNATVNAEFAALQLGAILRMSPIFERLRLTSISAADEIDGLARESAGNLGWDFLDRLRQSGREAASVWLERQPGN
jgi:NTE family protein